MSARGRFIVIEGPDGVGRTSVLRRLREGLAAEDRRVVSVRLRGSAGMREPLRDLQRQADIAERALFLLYAADLADLWQREIEPALEAGTVVLCDRFTMTPVLRAATRGIDPVWARAVLDCLPEPDLTLVLEADARLRLRRMLERRRFLTPRESGFGATFRRDPQAMLIRYQRQLDALFRERVNGRSVRSLDASRESELVAADALALVREALRGLDGGGTS